MKEKEIKAEWDLYWLISPTAIVCTVPSHVTAKHFILNLRKLLIYPGSSLTLNENEIFTALADKTAN